MILLFCVCAFLIIVGAIAAATGLPYLLLMIAGLALALLAERYKIPRRRSSR